MKRSELMSYLAQVLTPDRIRDFCPNGLQVEGKTDISRIVTGVTASEALIDAAIERHADAIIVHHGYFWKGESPVVTGMKKRRLQKLLANDINLIAYHLPLDIHAELGNNAQLAKRLGITASRGLDSNDPNSVAMVGELTTPMELTAFGEVVEHALSRKPLLCAGGSHLIKTIGYCTGGGQSYIDAAAAQGIDAFITGEVSEQTIHTSREMGIHFIAAGHHATERYGAKALGEHLATVYDTLHIEFVDIDNPA